MTSPAYKHLYIHVPACTGRCHYCSFFTRVGALDVAAYLSHLQTEYVTRGFTPTPLKTLYCGGGTPGLLGCEGFRQLAACDWMRFEKAYEWTVELHPATVTPDLLACLASLGVNRISIGVQSFNEDTLTRCHRRHTAQQARAAIQLAREFIPDTGLDLIAGLPGVTLDEWQQTLEQALEQAPEHLSIYNLSIEPGCAWYGHMTIEDEVSCDAVLMGAEMLAKAGFERYETSNYARGKTRYCLHNLNTWHGGDYLGLGEGASSRLGTLRRYANKEEHLSPLDDTLERAMTQLRLSEGFDIPALINHFPRLAPYQTAWQHMADTLRQQQLLDTHFAPTARGYEVLDAMTECFLQSLS